MQYVIDHYKGQRNTAEKFSHYPSDAAREADPAYVALQADLKKDYVGEADAVIVPIVSGKDMADWNLWQSWETQMINEDVQLDGLARGISTAPQVDGPVTIAQDAVTRFLQ
ncbi:hypothetical protein GCM10027090_38650 [Sinomonas soli]